jgi:hypothetical protein
MMTDGLTVAAALLVVGPVAGAACLKPAATAHPRWQHRVDSSGI